MVSKKSMLLGFLAAFILGSIVSAQIIPPQITPITENEIITQDTLNSLNLNTMNLQCLHKLVFLDSQTGAIGNSVSCLQVQKETDTTYSFARKHNTYYFSIDEFNTNTANLGTLAAIQQTINFFSAEHTKWQINLRKNIKDFQTTEYTLPVALNLLTIPQNILNPVNVDINSE